MSVPDVAPAVKILTKQLEEARAEAARCEACRHRELEGHRRFLQEAEGYRAMAEKSSLAQQKHEEVAVELEKALFALTGAEPQW